MKVHEAIAQKKMVVPEQVPPFFFHVKKLVNNHGSLPQELLPVSEFQDVEAA